MTKRKRKRKPAAPPRGRPAMAQHQEPPVEHQELPVETRPGGESGEPAWHFWPPDREMPLEHIKVRRRPQPCPRCRRVYLDTGGQAVVCGSSDSLRAAFRCMACGHRWTLPVRMA